MTRSQLRKTSLDMMRGGALAVEEHGQISLGFYRFVTDEQRREFREKLSELLRPRRRYTKRIKIDPLAVQRQGEHVLAEDDRDPIAHNACTWFVRACYVSEGGELLCFDAGPFVELTAIRVKAELAHHEPRVKWSNEHHTWLKPPGAELPQPKVWHGTRDYDMITTATNAMGARHVMLPSQRESLQRRYNEAIASDPTLARAGIEHDHGTNEAADA